MGMMNSVTDCYRRMEGYIGPERKNVRLCILLSLGATILLYTVPYMGGVLLDRIVDPDISVDLSWALDVCTLILLMVTLWYVAAMHSKSIMVKIALKTSRKMREDMNQKMLRVPVSYMDQMPSGDLSSRFTSDLPMVSALISTDFVGFIVYLTVIAAILVMMFITSPILALVYVLMIPVMLYSSRRLTMESEEDFTLQKEKVADLNSRMSDIIRTHDSIRMENLEEEVLEGFNSSNRDFTKAFISSQIRSGMISPVISIAVNLGYFMTVVVGAVLMVNGMLQVGMFLAFMIYVRNVNSPLLLSSTAHNKMRDEIISLTRVLEVIEAPEEEVGDRQDVEISKGEIIIEDLSFSYIAGKEVLHSVSLNIEPGQITAIVGPTGSGKTTIANLLMGFYKPDSGCLRIDGHDVNTISRRSFSNNVAAVLQDPWVFEGTIRENIVYNREGLTDEQILEVARLTGLDDYVRRLPAGYDTIIGSERKRIPLPQKRMLALTRAFIGNPKIFILDEAVAGLDPITGQRVIQGLKDKVQDCTVIIISHNQALIDQADHIVRLKGGRVVSDT